MVNRARLIAKIGDRKGSGLPSSGEAQRFNFDELAREVAGGLSRRGALKLAFTGLAGAALASLGIKTAWATTGDCTLVQVIPPSTDNVCTDSPFQGFEPLFQCCCVQHDYCFSTCGSSFVTCNASFHDCLVNQCQLLPDTERLQCELVALLMFRAVSTRFPDPPPNSPLPRSGLSRFLESQSHVCGCSCADGSVCGSGDMCSCDAVTGCTCVPCATCVTAVQFCA
jgi:hypothetical protein